MNSNRGPLNCNEYDSAFVSTDAQPPVLGITDGRIHASNDNADPSRKLAASGTDTESFTPSKVTDPSEFAGTTDGDPNAGPPTYDPLLPSTASAAVVPDVSPNRQYDTGPSAVTVPAYPDDGGDGGGDEAPHWMVSVVLGPHFPDLSRNCA